MNEEALIKIKSKVDGLDRELEKYIKAFLSGDSLTSDDKYSYSSNWAMNLFKDFKGTITITQ